MGTDHGGESSQPLDVVQVDNAILQRQPQTGTIAAKHGFCAWLHVLGPEVLKELTLDRGEAISNAWAGSLSGGSSLRPATGKNKAIVTGLGPSS